MASDFYKRTKDLFEEFQKRELQYLNSERATRGHFPVIKESNMPAQKYLEIINKREKETDETYLELMRHMEQLDHHTESITGKLRKLESLRISMSSNARVWPSNAYDTYSSNAYDKSFQDYTSSSIALKTDNTLSDTLQINKSMLSKQKVVEYASTQTDLMFCENCQFPLTVSTLSFHESLSPNNPLNTVVPPLQNPNLPPQVIKTDIASKIITPFSGISENESNLNLNKEKLSVITQSLPKIPEETYVQKENLHDRYQTVSADISLPMPLNTKSLENEISTTVLSTTDTNIAMAIDYNENVDERMNEQLKTDTPIATDYKENVPVVRLDEKVNVVNSDKNGSDSNLHSVVVSEVLAHSEINKDSNLSANDIVVDDLSTLSVTQNISQLESEGEITISKNNLRGSASKQDVLSDKGSESPISIAGAPSPSPYSDTVSALSDSDSFDEKVGGKVSAAYQALLGNVSASKKIQKTITYSESESEDEVERALANVTRKSSSVPTTIPIQEEKPDDAPKTDAAEPKAKNEPRKSISLSKSQQLSKSTRKVLGLDTSSGSEGEIRIPEKTSKKAEEESDDEFFYD